VTPASVSAAGWDRVAQFYALQARWEVPALEVSVALADVTPIDRVLDAACGTGLWSRTLLASGAQPARLTGVDQSRKMLERASAVGSLEPVQAPLHALPFPDASFDVVALSYALHLLSHQDVAAALHELARVLAPDGRIVAVTPCEASGPLGRMISCAARIASDTRWRALGGLRPMDPAPALDATGFRVDHSERIHRGYPSWCVRARPVSARSTIEPMVGGAS